MPDGFASDGSEEDFAPGRRAVKNGISASTVDFLRMTQEFSQDAEENTCEVLASNALFRHCDALLPYTAAPKAPRVNLKPKEVLELQNRGPVYIIESGVVEAQVGDGPVVVLGAGQVLNAVGFLGIAHEAEPFKPSGLDAPALQAPKAVTSGAYELFKPGQAPFSLFAERRGGRHEMVGPAPGKVCFEDTMCFFSLCPNAVSKLGPPGLAPKMNGWLPLRIVGGPAPNEEEEEEEESSCTGGWRLQPGGGARLVALELALVEEVGRCLGEEGERAKALRQALAIFREQSQVLSDRWRSMITRCCGAFPGMPPEVAWRLPETSIVGYWGCAFVDGKESKISWRSDTLSPGQRVAVLVTDEGDLKILVDRTMVASVSGAVKMTTETKLYPVLDIFAATVAVELVPEAIIQNLTGDQSASTIAPE